jgi:basic membrane protein A
MKISIASFVASTITVAALAAPAAADGTFVYVTPNPIGNNAFLALGRDGTMVAAAAIGAKVKVFESDGPSAIAENLYAAANEGANIIVTMGFDTVDAVVEVAPTAPDSDFLLIDACPKGDRPPNLHCAVFREHEASFLMGAMAAMVTKTNIVGAVGPIDTPFMRRFTGGFAAGAVYAKPDIKVETRWVGGQRPFADPVRAKEQALSLHALGADVVYAAAAGGSFGAFEAASEQGFKIMTVDSNLCGAASGAMYDSALKRVDQAIKQSIEAIAAGADAHFASYGLAEKAVGAVALLSDDELAKSGCEIASRPDVVKAIREIAGKIIAGEVKVADPLTAK